MNEQITLPLASIYIPPRQRPGYLLICLPGKGGCKEDFAGLEEEIWHPRLGYLFVDPPYPDYGGGAWYVNPGDRSRALRELHALQESLEKLGYPPKRCFLLGFSQGGSMALEASAVSAQTFAGSICISGRIEDLPELMHAATAQFWKQANCLVTHGTDDTALSIELTRQQVAKLQERGLNIEFHAFAKGHSFDFTHELPLIHRWVRQRIR